MEAFRVRVPSDEVELALDSLWAEGVAGIEERALDDGGVDLVTGFTIDVEDAAVRIGRAVAGRWPVEVDAVDPASWLDAWRPWARCTRVAGVVLHPPWVPLTAGPGDLVVELEPAHAWGHGGHPSTVLAAELMVAAGLDGRSVLDVGCGSGALSLVAAASGARRVVAVDLDPEARRVTAANAERNALSGRIDVLDGGLDDVSDRFDLVVANLGVGVLHVLTPAVLDRAAPHGAGAILSGLLEGQRTWGPEALEVDRRADAGWLAVRLRRG